MYELNILDFMCERKIEDTFEIYRNKEMCWIGKHEQWMNMIEILSINFSNKQLKSVKIKHFSTN